MLLRNCEFDANGYCENNALRKGVKKVFRFFYIFIILRKNSPQIMFKISFSDCELRADRRTEGRYTLGCD
jgi:hypothetical protein